MRLLDRLLIGAALLAVLALASGRAAAQIYRWVDERGTVHYTEGLDNVPERYRSRAQQLTLPKPPPPPEPGAATTDIAAIERLEEQLPNLDRGRVALVETQPRRRGWTSGGTAWAAGRDGWVSARHVVESCDAIGLAGGRWREPDLLVRDPDADVLAFRAGVAAPPLALAAAPPGSGEPAFGVGYPQRQPGVALLRLRGTGRAKLAGRIGSGRPFRTYIWEVVRYPLIAGERENTRGLSGGPVLDASGHVVAVWIFSAVRRREIGSVSLSDLRRAVDPLGGPAAGAGRAVAPVDFDVLGRHLLDQGSVARVACRG